MIANGKGISKVSFFFSVCISSLECSALHGVVNAVSRHLFSSGVYVARPVGSLNHLHLVVVEQHLHGFKVTEQNSFGQRCLLARRLSEAGVRFVQVNYSDQSTNPRWDQHSNMPQHAIHAKATDKPVAGLLQDLKQRGLLEDTLVWWGGEFGRTPFSQGSDGRDHNPRGFTVFLAGGGVKAGFSYGGTDEIGHLAVDGKVHMHDLHATLLAALGLDHEKLTYRYAGRDFRLTDVYGRVVHELFA